MSKTEDEFVRKWGKNLSIYGDFNMSANNLLYGSIYYMTFQRAACKEMLAFHDESYRT